MNLKEIIKCQDRYNELKKQITMYLNSYMEVIENKIIEISKENNTIMYLKKCDDEGIQFNFYEYTIIIKKSESFGVPEEINKSHQLFSIKDIAEGKSDVFCGCITVLYSDPDFNENKYDVLSKLYVNSDGVYKMGKVLSGGRNTFKDDCKVILYESIGNIYTSTCPVFPVRDNHKIK